MKAIDVTSCQHAGMALSTINPPARNDTWLNRLQSFVTLKPPASYQRAVERWSKLSADLPGLTQRWAITRSSLAIGTGNFSPAENGLSLHGTWGVPYLPGAALKGLASRAATWFDLSPSESEVMTPHAAPYYSSRGKKAPDDSQDPIPIQFLVVPKNTRFLVTLDCPEDRTWAETAMTILDFGLTKLGLGGMTSSGYGRFTVTSVGAEA